MWDRVIGLTAAAARSGKPTAAEREAIYIRLEMAGTNTYCEVMKAWGGREAGHQAVTQSDARRNRTVDNRQYER
jgi:hypothetical protein